MQQGILTRVVQPKQAAFFFFSGYLLLSMAVILLYDGTGDAGDSINHYLFARYAPSHPALYFDHWAKPLYVLLASPFAQFGFTGIKVFNVFCTAGSMYFSYACARRMKWRNPLLAAIFQAAIPLGFVLSFSGLTEPLFALVLAGGLYLILIHRSLAAAIAISFLPFVRSEGLILAGIAGLYFLAKRNWRAIPLLAFGHVVYSFAGWPVHGELLWVFTKIPYANAASPYGNGELLHFVKQMIYTAGVPISALLVFGLMSVFTHFSSLRVNPEFPVLIAGGFLAFFIAHTLFWYLGIFNSMGLTRVFVGVSPLMALLAHKGYSEIHNLFGKLNPKAGTISGALLIAYVLVFPLTAHPGAIRPEKNLYLKADQECAWELVRDIPESGTSTRYFVAHPYVNLVLNIDPFDDSRRVEPTPELLETANPGDLCIWDNWFCVMERKIERSDVERHGFRLLRECWREERGREIHLAVYIKE